MQLTNGAITKSATPPPMSNQLAVQELEGVDLETFDLSAFVITGKTKDKNAVAVLAPEVVHFVKESEALFKLGEKFELEVVQRGHQSLYELLASIYGLALRIEESPQKDQILDAIRKDLKDNHDTIVKSNSTPINVMVKYVIRTDKPAATRYAKVLSVARQEKPLSRGPACLHHPQRWREPGAGGGISGLGQESRGSEQQGAHRPDTRILQLDGPDLRA